MESPRNDMELMDREPRRSILLVDPDPLLRWSIVTYLHKWFDVQIAETVEHGRRLLLERCFHAVILSNGCKTDELQDLEDVAKSQNQTVTIVRLVTGVEGKSREPDVQYLEKPFELTSLSEALGAGKA